MLPTDPPFSLQIAYARIRDWHRAKYTHEKFDKDSNSLTILQFDGLNLIISNSPEVGRIACVAWRFCRAGRRSGVAARKIKKIQVAPAPISSRFLCPRPPLLLSSPNQNRHATQAMGRRRSLKEIITCSLSLPFSLFPPRQLFACLSLSRLPYYLRAWNRLYLKMHCR